MADKKFLESFGLIKDALVSIAKTFEREFENEIFNKEKIFPSILDDMGSMAFWLEKHEKDSNYDPLGKFGIKDLINKVKEISVDMKDGKKLVVLTIREASNEPFFFINLMIRNSRGLGFMTFQNIVIGRKNTINFPKFFPFDAKKQLKSGDIVKKKYYEPIVLISKLFETKEMICWDVLEGNRFRIFKQVKKNVQI